MDEATLLRAVLMDNKWCSRTCFYVFLMIKPEGKTNIKQIRQDSFQNARAIYFLVNQILKIVMVAGGFRLLEEHGRKNKKDTKWMICKGTASFFLLYKGTYYDIINFLALEGTSIWFIVWRGTLKVTQSFFPIWRASNGELLLVFAFIEGTIAMLFHP